MVLPCLDFTLEHQYGCEYHMVTRAGSSSTQTTIGSFTCLDGLIIRNEKSHKFHENLNSITRLRDIWFHVNPPLLRGCAKFFKPEHNNEFREGDKLVRLEFSIYYCFSELKLCMGGEGLLS